MLPTVTSAALSVHFTLPPASIFRFPPSDQPAVLSPAASDYSLARPVNINPTLYHNLLGVRYPITIALVYATTVTLFNRVNRRRGYKPWAVSKTRAFFAFIILHNVFLATYSLWTFVGMVNVVRASWPGWHGEYGLIGVADAMCKINGPRGLGNAVSYNASTTAWSIVNPEIRLLAGLPDPSDVGRIWNEGLAFYGWLFYLSKFYEVIDTLIILAKGKRSSSLQTYHHAGAMFCMWAGIRYMSPPIWMFVLVNSGIHALMYSYYALAGFGIRTPFVIKRTLTTMQILQLVVGFFFAIGHLFVAYSISVSTPYRFFHNLSTAAPSMALSASSAFASATGSVGLSNWIKKIALRAAGEEGLAENVRNAYGQPFGIDAIHNEKVQQEQEEIRYKLEHPMVNCIDTDGQAFAILLNVMYLAPLIVLFVRFFIKSYVRRTGSSSVHPTKEHAIKKSTHDAFKSVEREMFEAMEDTQGTITPEVLEEAKSKSADIIENTKRQAKDAAGSAKDDFRKGTKKLNEEASWFGSKARAFASDAKNQTQVAANDVTEKAKATASDFSEKAKPVAKNLKENGKTIAKYLSGKAQETTTDVVEKGEAAAADLGKGVSQKVEESAQSGLSILGDKAKVTANGLFDKAGPVAENLKESSKEAADESTEKTNSKASNLDEKVGTAMGNLNDGGKSAAEDLGEKVQSAADGLKAATSDATTKAKDTAESTTDAASGQLKSAAHTAQGKAEAVARDAMASPDASSAEKSGAEGSGKKGKKSKKAKQAKKKAEVDRLMDEADEKAAAQAQEDAVHAADEVAAEKVGHDFEMVSKDDKERVPNGSSTAGPNGAAVGEAAKDESAYEANIDEAKSAAEAEAKADMQPEGV